MGTAIPNIPELDGQGAHLFVEDDPITPAPSNIYTQYPCAVTATLPTTARGEVDVTTLCDTSRQKRPAGFVDHGVISVTMFYDPASSAMASLEGLAVEKISAPGRGFVVKVPSSDAGGFHYVYMRGYVQSLARPELVNNGDEGDIMRCTFEINVNSITINTTAPSES